MNEDNLSLDKALSEAQAKGFAEPDPTMDIQGFDSAHKLAILASLCFGVNVTPDKIYTEGITGIDIEDIKNAKEFGYVIKLLAIARQLENNKVELKVHPTMIPKIHPLASVRNEFNAVYLHGDAVGEMMFYGKGAGPFPTASALLSDIIEIATRTVPVNKQLPDNWGNNSVIRMDDTSSEHYLRFPILDTPGVIGKIATVLGKHNISIYGATATLVPTKRALGHVRVLTKKAKESEIKKALSEISRLSIMRGKPAVIRIEE
jgi:homoserine dehydrogenase